MNFDKILCMQYEHRNNGEQMVNLSNLTIFPKVHEIFLNFSTELWPLIDVKISIF